MHILQLYEAKTMVSEPCDEWLENRSSLVWHDWRIAYVLQQQLRSCDAIVLFKEMVLLSERSLRLRNCMCGTNCSRVQSKHAGLLSRCRILATNVKVDGTIESLSYLYNTAIGNGMIRQWG